jgi:putative transposase
MPNHLHALIKPGANHTISQALQSFGSFTAHAILTRLQETRQTALLTHFAQRQDGDPNKNHQIWQPIQAKNVWSVSFMWQKLEYIHNNPVVKGWELVEDRAAYDYSSACFYDRGEAPGIAVDDINEWVAD